MQVDSIIDYIKLTLEDSDYNIQLKPEWGSENQNYRLAIRQYLAEIRSHYFKRNQLAQLFDLNQRPMAAAGSVSISHCKSMGGFSYSVYQHGFDIEEVERISDPVIIRTATEQERSQAPHIKFLWVAKEAALKALSSSIESDKPLLITDLYCKNWLEIKNSQIWSFQIKSSENLNFKNNFGLVFTLSKYLISIYFR